MIIVDAELLFWLHMIALGYALGSDFVVNQRTFYLIGARDVSPEERTRLLRSLLLSDQHPRMGLILVITSGIAMESLAGRHLPPDYLPWVYLVGALWLLEIWVAFLNEPKPWARALSGVDVAWRYALAAAFLTAGVWSLLGDGPLGATWLSPKSVLLSVILGGGVSVRFLVRDLQAAWPRYLQDGSTPAFEAVLQRAMKRAIGITWTIWALYLAIGALTVLQPGGH